MDAPCRVLTCSRCAAFLIGSAARSYECGWRMTSSSHADAKWLCGDCDGEVVPTTTPDEDMSTALDLAVEDFRTSLMGHCNWCNDSGNIGGGSLGSRECHCADDNSVLY